MLEMFRTGLPNQMYRYFVISRLVYVLLLHEICMSDEFIFASFRLRNLHNDRDKRRRHLYGSDEIYSSHSADRRHIGRVDEPRPRVFRIMGHSTLTRAFGLFSIYLSYMNIN